MAEKAVCRVPGCGEKRYLKGLCNPHYQQWRRDCRKDGEQVPPETWVASGRPRKRDPKPVFGRVGCLLSWCDGKHSVMGFCARHYRWWVNDGRPDPKTWNPSKVRPTGRPRSNCICRVEDCGGKHCSLGFCQPHYRRFDRARKKDPNITPETWVSNNRLSRSS